MLLIAAGDHPERLRSEASFAAFCGVGPVEASSGKTNVGASTGAETGRPTPPSTPSCWPVSDETPAPAATWTGASPHLAAQ
ncbi:transposase [Streptomyces sp. NPDC054887]